MSKQTDNQSHNIELLSEDEKARIRAEEAFRAELRQQFSQPKASGLWTFLNSAFGLWLLGSVTLGGITFLYQSFVSSKQEAAAHTEMMAKVFEELEMHLESAHYSLKIDAAANPTSDKTKPSPSLDELVLAATLFYRLVQLTDPPNLHLGNAWYNWKYLEPKLVQGQCSSEEIDRRLGDISKQMHLPSTVAE